MKYCNQASPVPQQRRGSAELSQETLPGRPLMLSDATGEPDQDTCLLCFEPLDPEGGNCLIPGHYIHAICEDCSKKWIALRLEKFSAAVTCPMCPEHVPVGVIATLLGPSALLVVCERRDAVFDSVYCRNPACSSIINQIQEPTLRLHERSRDFGADGVVAVQ